MATTRDDLVARPVTTGLGVLGMPGVHGVRRPARDRQTAARRDVVVAAAVAAASGAASVRVWQITSPCEGTRGSGARCTAPRTTWRSFL